MAGTIKITPQELRAQAAEMRALEGDFSALFAGVSADLKKVNANWSPNLSHNFEGKINSAQNSFARITEELLNGAKAAETCAVSFQSIDSELAKLYFAGEPTGVTDAAREIVEGLPERIHTTAEGLAWLEEQYGQLPEWLTHGVDVLVPSVVKNAYNLVSGLIQGDLGHEELWGAFKGLVKSDPRLSAVCYAIEYTCGKSQTLCNEMEKESAERILKGDILGGLFTEAEGFVDIIVGGSVETLGHVAGGVVDGIIDDTPVLKGINKLVEYGTGLIGGNDGEGYSIGGLVGGCGEAISAGIDFTTDIISDGVDMISSGLGKIGSGFRELFR